MNWKSVEFTRDYEGEQYGNGFIYRVLYDDESTWTYFVAVTDKEMEFLLKGGHGGRYAPDGTPTIQLVGLHVAFILGDAVGLVVSTQGEDGEETLAIRWPWGEEIYYLSAFARDYGRTLVPVCCR